MAGDRVKVNITAGGTGALTLGSAVSGFRTPAAAGLADEYRPYLIEWSGGWETGMGKFSADALSFTRLITAFGDSSTGSTTNVPNSGATLAIEAIEHGQLLHGGMLQRSVLAQGAQSFGGTADQPDMRTFGSLVNGGERWQWDLSLTTGNATPADMRADGQAGSNLPAIPAGVMCLVEVKVVGLISNTSGQVGGAYARKMTALGKSTGQIGATVNTAVANDAAFTGNATLSLATGQIRITCTGMAASTINWAASVDVTPVYATP